ncbi:MAG: DNA mismatch repair protein MutS [Candidatus Fluviicola riflensis]|nr:MAG: DNA mismatch repair protein MutS [Candidatus Fluviicola riflensis]OGS77186.1 MAG: DNA mismatch repair protein MutS [Candidatus Fluviicola riflensis]OGS82121.1 MAG: DNA mismatch repair protein MutS [Fluviicola sp. RIFCSPHIGHO2_01_FULL_43_53]OGS87815.1 MAG: DNA mismatch repair protein MutS [Fluviicola sp. RIFCSPHIGHO2_12_FULL_43_24]
MNGFDRQTLHDLEFVQIREWLTAYSIGETAQQRLADLEPSNDFPLVEQALLRVAEFKTIRTDGESFPSLDFDELLPEIRLLPIKNAVLQQEGFVRIVRASDLVNSLLHFFDKRSLDFPELTALLTDVYHTRELIDSIEKVFDRKGQIKDDASPELMRIRQQIGVLRNQINRNFDKEMRKWLKEGMLGETKEAFVNERRVLTVMSSHKRKIGGSVVGSSKTGSLTFIEPAVNVPLNNELELSLDDERKEIFRILQELTREIAHHLPLIEAYQILLTELDFINAKTKLALELNAVLPGIVRHTRIELIDAFHPILWKTNKQAGKPTLPQSLILDQNGRMLVISGPNAGGKSITLKTIGLLQIMLQAGLLVPVHENSQLCFFQQVLTDIGDNQSIENELSTYSYRLKRMKHFLRVANKRTLLLLDEFGTGSDPELGGALAEVFFEELYKRKSYAVITTHYANIKLKADRLPQAVNGCMLFDTETLEPLYRFSMGQPGSSFTFEVAQMNGIPLNLIEEAKGKLDDSKVNMDKLLHELNREKSYLEQLNKAHIEAQELAEAARLDYIQKKERFEERMRAQQDVIEKNNLYLNSGKKMKQFIDRYQTKSRKKDINNPLLEDVKKYLLVEKSKIEESKRKDELVKQAGIPVKKPKKQKPGVPEKDPYQRDKIVLGSTVKMIETKQSGTVEEIKGHLLTVVFGFMRLKVEREKLMWVK